MRRIKETRQTLLVCLLLAAATVAVYLPVVHHEFIYYDDPQYVGENPRVPDGLTWANVKWAMTSGFACNWHPVTWISHMLDVRLFGLQPGGHHLTNLLFHTADSLLLLILLKRMTGALWRSAFVAALFALHPLHVESVAWVAERKDVLSAFFFMVTLLAYARYAEARGPKRITTDCTDGPGGESPGTQSEFRRRAALWYGLALLSFALGLMSKPMLVTLPFVLLLLDYWPLQRFNASTLQRSRAPSLHHSTTPSLPHSAPSALRLVVEKLPFFALSAASCVITLLVQSEAMENPIGLPLGTRLNNAAVACVAYLGQTLWPTHLAVFYPYPIALAPAAVIGATVLLLAITVAAVVLARRRPCLPVGWFWYLGMLVPVIGLVQVGSQARADRYTYLPLIGIFLMVAWGLMPSQKSEVRSRKAEVQSPESKVQSPHLEVHTSQFSMHNCLVAGGACLVLLALALTAHRQVGHWRTSKALFEHAAQVTEGNYTAWGGIGIADLHQGDYDGAMTNLTRAYEYARSRNADEGVCYYLGAALQMQNKWLEALPYLEKAQVSSDLEPMKNCRLALSLMNADRLPEAETALKQALAARPDNPEIQLAAAALAYRQGQNPRAETIFRQVLAAHPDLAMAHERFAAFLMLTGRPAEAEHHYQAALKLDPSSAALRHQYAAALIQLCQTTNAIAQLKESLKLQPKDAEASFALAELLSQQGRNREAVPYYDQAIAADPKPVTALNNLAWLLATDPDNSIRNGPRAVALAERACQLAGWKEPFLIGTLAAAYAEAGRFGDAVATAEKARDLARTNKLEKVVKRNEELLQLYRAGKPYHESVEASKR